MPELLNKHAASPLPRPVSRRGWAIVGIGALLVVALFSIVLQQYNAEGGLTVTGAQAEPTGSGLRVRVTPLSVDPQLDQFTARFGFEPESLVDLFDAEGRLTRNLRITVYSPDGSTEFKYAIGDQLSPQTATLGMSGQVAAYPFDTYNSILWFSAEEIKAGPDGAIVRDKPLSTRTDPWGGVMNWNTRMSIPPGWNRGEPTLVDFSRVFSTQVFALVMLSLMAVLALVSAVIAFLAVSNRRRAEMGMLSWLAGLLFAFPALRRTMPDAPPIGVTIDIVVFLWTLLLALLSALAVAVAWWVQSRAVLLVNAPGSDSGAAQDTRFQG